MEDELKSNARWGNDMGNIELVDHEMTGLMSLMWQ